MDWNDLVGTWKYPRIEEPDSTGWMEFLRDGRIYMPMVDPANPQQRFSVWLRGNIESLDAIRVFPKGDDVGWTVSFQLENDTLRLFKAERAGHFCTRTSLEDAPQWFRDDVAKAISLPPS